MELVIKQLRERKGMSVSDLASAANVSETTIYAIESSRNSHPSTATLEKIATALGVKIPHLWGRVEIVRD